MSKFGAELSLLGIAVLPRLAGWDGLWLHGGGVVRGIKVSTAKWRVLWLGASGKNSKDGMALSGRD